MSTASTGAPHRPPLQPGRHIAALDGVRGLAIAAVMLHHFNILGAPSGVGERTFAALAQTGWAGVDLFFVLSGFLITGILYRTKSAESYFSSFYARRALRIFPLYYAALALIFLLPRLLQPGNALFAAVSADQIWYWTHLANIKVALDGWPLAFTGMGHFWSLAVEEQFYLVWPFVVYALSRERLMMLCGLMAVGALAVRAGLVLAGYGIPAYVFTAARVDALAVGAFIALAATTPAGRTALARFARPTALLAAAGLALLYAWRGGLYWGDPFTQTIGYTLFALAFGGLVTAAATAGDTRLSRLLAHAPLRALGRYSYALYIFHYPVSVLLQRTMLDPETLAAAVGSAWAAQALFLLAATAASLALSLLSWHLLEKHFLTLKDKFVPGVRSQRVSPQAAAA